MKRALVTGGSGALGSAICRQLARDGLTIVVHGHRHLDAAQQVAAEIAAGGGQAQAVAFDITDAQSSAAALEVLLAEGPIQVLVNNAAIYDDAPLAGMRGEQWTRVIEVSLNGFFNVTQPLLLPMLATRWGRIINISSISGILGNRGQSNYAAAKAGLHGATRSLSLEVAARGVTVNAVAPGIIRSPLTDNAFSQEAIERLVPMKRAGTPTEVADLVSFLASERAAYITGQIISVNGGIV